MLDIEKLAKAGQLFDGHYALIRPLSIDGATADVWLALDMNTVTEDVEISDVAQLHDDEIEKLGLVVAIKIYRPQNALDLEGEQRFRDEYMIVFNCHHTNLIHPTHFSIFNETPYLVLPYCRLGSSELLIGSKLDNKKIWNFILDVSSGIAYLHAQIPPIVHQDIKPANILLDDTLHYAITDFGISSQRGGVHNFYNDEDNSGTLAYMAPERFQEGAPIPQSDVWAFGATLCEILTGKVPFGEEGGKMQIETNAPMPTIPGVSTSIQKLIHTCLSRDPKDRPSAEQIVKIAKAELYPTNINKYKYGILVVFATLIGISTFLFTKLSDNTQSYQLSPKEQYEIALNLINGYHVDSLKAGIKLMDSLSSNNYIPAIYQMAFTYGWYSDSNSVRRKQMLGIAMDEGFLPISDRYSNQAVALFTRILEINDSSFADINANAAYRLACYYVMPNNIYKPNYEKGKKFLLRSKEWALMAGDSELLKKIEKGLTSF